MTETTKRLNALKVNQALVDAEGNFLTASVTLGLPNDQALRKYVNEHPELQARWTDKPNPPSDILAPKRDDLAIAEAVERENAKLKEGVETLGLSDRAKSLALSCQRFQRQNYSAVQQMTNGGITVAFLEALAELEGLTKKLDDMSEVKEEQRLAQESIWREAQAHLRDFIFKAATKVDQGILIQAKIQKMFGENNGGAPQNSKPGFSPLKKANATQEPA